MSYKGVQQRLTVSEAHACGAYRCLQAAVWRKLPSSTMGSYLSGEQRVSVTCATGQPDQVMTRKTLTALIRVRLYCKRVGVGLGGTPIQHL